MKPDIINGKIDMDKFIETKTNEYVEEAKKYYVLYYLTRLLGGLCAGILPFVISSEYKWLPISLSILIVVLTVIDLVFNPKDRWALFSKATDLLAVARIKKQGDYDAYKEIIDIFLKTESGNLERLIDMKELFKTVEMIQKKSDGTS